MSSDKEKLDKIISEFLKEQADLGCWNTDFEYRLRRALIKYNAIHSKKLREENERLRKVLESVNANLSECQDSTWDIYVGECVFEIKQALKGE